MTIVNICDRVKIVRALICAAFDANRTAAAITNILTMAFARMSQMARVSTFRMSRAIVLWSRRGTSSAGNAGRTTCLQLPVGSQCARAPIRLARVHITASIFGICEHIVVPSSCVCAPVHPCYTASVIHVSVGVEIDGSCAHTPGHSRDTAFIVHVSKWLLVECMAVCAPKNHRFTKCAVAYKSADARTLEHRWAHMVTRRVGVALLFLKIALNSQAGIIVYVGKRVEVLSVLVCAASEYPIATSIVHIGDRVEIQAIRIRASRYHEGARARLVGKRIKVVGSAVHAPCCHTAAIVHGGCVVKIVS